MGKISNKYKAFNACRACMAYNVDLFPVLENDITGVFEFCLRHKFAEVERLVSRQVCEKCLDFLKKMRRFQLRCGRAQKVLSELVKWSPLPTEETAMHLFKETLKTLPIYATLDDPSIDMGKVLQGIELPGHLIAVNPIKCEEKCTKVYKTKHFQSIYNKNDTVSEDEEMSLATLRSHRKGITFFDKNDYQNTASNGEQTSSKGPMTSNFLHNEYSNILNLAYSDLAKSLQQKHDNELQNINTDLESEETQILVVQSEGNDATKIFIPVESDRNLDTEEENEINKSLYDQQVDLCSNGDDSLFAVTKARSYKKSKRNAISNEVKIRSEVQKPIKVKKEKPHYLDFDRFDTFVKFEYNDFATEIFLSLEEQKAEMENKRKSDDYKLRLFRCDMCVRVFTSEDILKKHMPFHDEKAGPYECPLCHVRFRLGSHCRKHMRNTHIRRYKCRLCDHICKNLIQLKAHKDWHDGITYQCPFCGLTFRYPNSYYLHRRAKHPSEFLCDICGEGCSSETGLRAHKRKSHNMKIPYKPRVYRNGNIQKLIPTTETYKDDINIAAKHDANLIVEPESYEISGTNDVQNKITSKHCRECDVTFKTVVAYLRHFITSTKHQNKHKNTCIVCEETFTNQDLFHKHMKRHVTSCLPKRSNLDLSQYNQARRNTVKRKRDPNAVIKNTNTSKSKLHCATCGIGFKKLENMMMHQHSDKDEKPYKCKWCEKRFNYKYGLENHERLHTGARPYQCHSCPKNFRTYINLYRHNMTHTGEKPYACKSCDKKFSQLNNLKLHVSSVHLKIPDEYRLNRKRKLQNAVP